MPSWTTTATATSSIAPSPPAPRDAAGDGCPVAARGGGGPRPTAAADDDGGGWWGTLWNRRPAAAEAPLSSSTADATASAALVGGAFGGNVESSGGPVGARDDVAAAGGCPVRHGGGGGSRQPQRRDQQIHPFGVPRSGGAVTPPAAAAAAAVAASIEEEARHPQSARPGQSVPLDTRRVVSSIPRADDLRPRPPPAAPPAIDADADGGGGSGGCDRRAAAPHQPPASSRWVYPSEQQFYNATVRKGWTVAPESIPAVVRIHNAVNERGWAEVRRWERELHGNPRPRLVKFEGRPGDPSPRAWFNENVLGRRPPFDRHDWYVDRGLGGGGEGGDGGGGSGDNLRRYVIDFYDGNPATSAPDPDAATSSPPSSSGGCGQPKGVSAGARAPVSMYLDVRPALDDPGAFYDRARMAVREALPGIFGGDGDYGSGGSGRGGRPDVGGGEREGGRARPSNSG